MKAGLLRLPALCIAAVILLTFGSASAEGLDVSAKGAVLIESRTGKVLYAKNAHEKLPMASTTKIMTALLAIENGNLSDIIETDASAYGSGQRPFDAYQVFAENIKGGLGEPFACLGKCFSSCKHFHPFDGTLSSVCFLHSSIYHSSHCWCNICTNSIPFDKWDNWIIWYVE